MLSNDPGNNSSKPQASPLSDAKADGTDPVPFLKPGDPIEVASSGNGTTIDPPAKDNRPPASYASDSSLA
jgi:hypothetical protein